MRGVVDRAERRSLAYPLLLGLSAIDAAGYSVIAPVVPAIAREAGVGPGAIGLMVAAFPVGIFLGFPVAAAGVRRRGSTAVLAASLVVVAVGTLGFVAGGGLGVYALSRFVTGVGSGGLWIGIVFGTFERWPGQEYLCMSRVFAAYSIGGLLGPGLGAIGGIRGPFLGYLVLVGLGALALPLLGTVASPVAFRPDRSALRLPGFWAASAAALFAISALGILDGVMPLHLDARLGQSQIGFLYVGLSLLVATGATLAGRVRPRAALVGAAGLVVAGIALTGASGSVAWWIPALAVAGLGIGAAETGSVGVLLEAVPTERIVTAMIVWSQLGIAGYLIGPVSGAWAAEAFGFGALGAVVAALGAGSLAVLVASPARGRT